MTRIKGEQIISKSFFLKVNYSFNPTQYLNLTTYQTLISSNYEFNEAKAIVNRKNWTLI